MRIITWKNNQKNEPKYINLNDQSNTNIKSSNCETIVTWYTLSESTIYRYYHIKSNSTNLIRRLDIKATHYAWLLLPIKKKLAAIGYYTFTSFTNPLVWFITRLTNTFIVGIFFNGDAYLKRKIILCEQLCFLCMHWDIECNLGKYIYLWDDIIKRRKKDISIAAYLFIDT